MQTKMIHKYTTWVKNSPNTKLSLNYLCVKIEYLCVKIEYLSVKIEYLCVKIDVVFGHRKCAHDVAV